MRAFELFEVNYGGVTRSIPLEKEQAEELLRTKCSQMVNSKATIYRGTYSGEQSPYLLTDPTKGGLRRAANTYNYMNLVMSNMDSWAHYPKRDRSLICATNKHNADNYGIIYRVYPFDGTLIGVCPQDDLWPSFKVLKPSTVNELCETLHHAYKNFFNKTMDEENFQTFMHQLAQLSSKLEAMSPEELEAAFYEDFIILLKRNKTLLNTIELCTPEGNGFKLMDTSNYRVTGNKEVWVGGPAVLVEVEYDIESN